MDLALLTLQLDPEQLYQTLQRTVESANVIIGTYSEDSGPMGELAVDPALGTVGFGSGLHGWAFTLYQFADMYAGKFGVEPGKLMRRLWGDQFYSVTEKKWSRVCGEGYVRGFTQYVMDPIYKVVDLLHCFPVISLWSQCCFQHIVML